MLSINQVIISGKLISNRGRLLIENHGIFPISCTDNYEVGQFLLVDGRIDNDIKTTPEKVQVVSPVFINRAIVGGVLCNLNPFVIKVPSHSCEYIVVQVGDSEQFLKENAMLGDVLAVEGRLSVKGNPIVIAKKHGVHYLRGIRNIRNENKTD